LGCYKLDLENLLVDIDIMFVCGANQERYHRGNLF
jgi:hypothetical protein